MLFLIDLFGGMLLSMIIIMGIGRIVTLPMHQGYPTIVNSQNISRLLVISIIISFLVQSSSDVKWWGFSESLHEASLNGLFSWIIAFIGSLIWYTILSGLCALGIGMTLTFSLLNNLDPSYENVMGMALIEMYRGAPAVVIINVLIGILTYSCVMLDDEQTDEADD